MGVHGTVVDHPTTDAKIRRFVWIPNVWQAKSDGGKSQQRSDDRHESKTP